LPRLEQDSFFRRVNADGQVFEMFVPGLGRPHAQGPGNLCPTAAALVGVLLFRPFGRACFRSGHYTYPNLGIPFCNVKAVR